LVPHPTPFQNLIEKLPSPSPSKASKQKKTSGKLAEIEGKIRRKYGQHCEEKQIFSSQMGKFYYFFFFGKF
jgi:hypothetical protein